VTRRTVTPTTPETRPFWANGPASVTAHYCRAIDVSATVLGRRASVPVGPEWLGFRSCWRDRAYCRANASGTTRGSVAPIAPQNRPFWANEHASATAQDCRASSSGTTGVGYQLSRWPVQSRQLQWRVSVPQSRQFRWRDKVSSQISQVLLVQAAIYSCIETECRQGALEAAS